MQPASTLYVSLFHSSPQTFGGRRADKAVPCFNMSRQHIKDVPTPAEFDMLQRRLNRVHLQQRLGIEAEHEVQIFGRGRNFFHIENWYSIHAFIRFALHLSLLYRRGRKNALDIRVRENSVSLQHLPSAFDGYTLLQLSDLHLDMLPELPHRIAETIHTLDFDLCVITGDFRAKTYGDIDNVLQAMHTLRPHLGEKVFAVLGNHDSVRLVPGLEAMGITMLLNESTTLLRDGQPLHLIGVDDPHYYRADNLEKALLEIQGEACTLLLSHSPELYRHAAHAGIDFMLSGHTHGGQICLPGGIPIMCNMRAPRRLCRGPWRHQALQGYTSAGTGVSVVEARLNCPAEVSLHRLHRKTDDQ